MKIGLLILRITKFVLILLLLGLGVNFGFFTPRGSFTPEYIGIFGGSYLYIVIATCLVYLVYRSVLATLNVIAIHQKEMDEELGKLDKQNKNQRIGEYITREAVLMVFLSIPIIVGIEWTKNSIDTTDAIFHFWRNIFALVIIGFVVFFYREKTDFFTKDATAN